MRKNQSSLPHSYQLPNGMNTSGSPPWPMPSWTAFSLTRTASNSRANRYVKNHPQTLPKIKCFYRIKSHRLRGGSNHYLDGWVNESEIVRKKQICRARSGHHSWTKHAGRQACKSWISVRFTPGHQDRFVTLYSALACDILGIGPRANLVWTTSQRPTGITLIAKKTNHRRTL